MRMFSSVINCQIPCLSLSEEPEPIEVMFLLLSLILSCKSFILSDTLFFSFLIWLSSSSRVTIFLLHLALSSSEREGSLALALACFVPFLFVFLHRLVLHACFLVH